MVDTTSTFDPLWAYVLGDYDDYYDDGTADPLGPWAFVLGDYDDKATAKPKDESREPEQQGRAEQEQATVTSRAAKSKAAKSKLKQKRDVMDKKSKIKHVVYMQSKAPGSKASESKSSVAGSKVAEAMSSQSKLSQNIEASQAEASERKPLGTVLGLKDAQETHLLRYANTQRIAMQYLINGMDKKSKMKLGMYMHSKTSGSKASESKSSVAGLKVAEAMSSQSKLAENSEGSQAKASKRKPPETSDDSKSYVSEEQESEATTTQQPDSLVTKEVKRKPLETREDSKSYSVSEEQEYEATTTQQPDSLVTKELHAPTKSATKAVSVTCFTGLKKLKKSIFGWKTKKQKKAKRGENSAIRIQSVVRGIISRGITRAARGITRAAERQKLITIRLQSLCRGVITQDLIITMKPKETSAVAKELHVPTKSGNKAATGLTGSRQSVFGCITKKQRKAKRRKNSAIRIQSVVRGGIGREISRAERRSQEISRAERRKQSAAIRLQSLRRGVIARDLIKSMKAKNASAVRIQSVARGSIVRNRIQRVARDRIVRDQVRTNNTAATRIQSNHRGHAVRKQHNLDKQKKVQKVQQDQTSAEGESFFGKYFVMSCSTGWETTESVAAADLSETPNTANTVGPITITEPVCDENYPAFELSMVPEVEVVGIQNQDCKE
jgi:hypothetical protein